MYRYLFQPLLFLLSAEKAHNFAAFCLQVASLPIINSIVKSSNKITGKPTEVMGLRFPSRLGLAAGFDKNAKMYKGLGALGFGFIEIGTVTPKPQPGNEKPRLFRLKSDNALINRMGFNNDGVVCAAKRLKSKSPSLIIGGNIGKNKVTPNEKALEDYQICFEELHEFVDYFVVNVSSPNTPGLRELQEKEPLKKILNALQVNNLKKNKPKPILLKVAPDLSESQLDDIVEIVLETKIEGVIATNTTISRENLLTSEQELNVIGNGGLSGEPLKKKSLAIVKTLKIKSKGRFTIIGVGGISSAEDAKNMMEAGADLVQLYSAFIYKGTKLIREINRSIN